MLQNNNKKRICIVVSSLGKGGAERSAATISKILESLGHEIHIVSVQNEIHYEYSGTLFNLGEYKDKKDGLVARIKRLIIFNNFLKNHKFDIIIDSRFRVQAYRELMVSKFIYKVPTIYLLHSHEESITFTKYKWLNKWLYKNETLVTVSKATRLYLKEKYGYKKVETIYNAFDFYEIIKKSNEEIDTQETSGNYILFLGRLHDQHKNLKLLFNAYQKSNLKAKDYKLILLGNGPDLDTLKDLANQLDITDMVGFKKFITNPFPYIKNAYFTVLSSRFEGFPMIIPESLGLGTPVVSVDCKSGPNEVIINEYNGLLVENFNEEALAKAFNRMVDDKQLYQTCKKNSEESVQQFSIETIKEEWEQLIVNL